MAIAKYVKAASERKRYQIDYTDWLDTGEIIFGASFSIDDNLTVPILVVDGMTLVNAGRTVQYYVSGGIDGRTYRILPSIVTTLGPQTKLDEVLMVIREP